MVEGGVKPPSSATDPVREKHTVERSDMAENNLEPNDKNDQDPRLHLQAEAEPNLPAAAQACSSATPQPLNLIAVPADADANRGEPQQPMPALSSRKAESARANGRKGGTKNPAISRWNALRHGRYAEKLSILEGKHLPEFGHFKQMDEDLQHDLGDVPLEDRIAAEKFVVDTWRLRRCARFELEATERNHHGMAGVDMPNVLRYSGMVHRQWEQTLRHLKQIRQRVAEASTERPACEAAGALDTPVDAHDTAEPEAGSRTAEEGTAPKPPAAVAKESTATDSANQEGAA